MTEPEPLQQVERTRVLFRNRKLDYFAGCDYFRLASHPAVIRAAADGLKNFGLNVAASRMTTGNHELYRTLETELAKFFGAEDALVLAGGYVTSLAVAQALAGQFSHVLIDERAHPALFDAAQMLDCPVLKFKHRDADDFAGSIARCGRGGRPIALTDGMFSRDGSVAPLRAYLKTLPDDGWLLVDDAHGAGVLGATGKGSVEHEGVGRKRVIQCVTLSKAFGAYGGVILGTAALRKQILDRSRLFVGSTPLPLPLAAAALASVKVLKAEKGLRRRLFENSNWVKRELRRAGIEIPGSPGPIIRLPEQGPKETAAFKKRLLAAGIFPPLLKYLGGPAGGYFRFVISSEHTFAQLDNLVRTIVSSRKSRRLKS